MKGLLCKKLGMTQYFTEEKLTPVTLLKVDSCMVTDLKTEEKDGYYALQLGCEKISPKKEKKLKKPLLGVFKSKKTDPLKHLVELRVARLDGFTIGQELKADTFEIGEKVNVSSVSKGKGFAGPMKRWNFSGAGASHGAHRNHRRGGSIGSSATPSRVFPGKKMAGRMGNEKVTVKNLSVVSIDVDNGIIGLKGAVPGANGALVMIKGSS